MEYDKDFLEEQANIVIKAESILNDADLMKQLKPIIEEIQASAERLKGFDFKSMRELAGKKALEEQEEAEKLSKDYHGSNIVLGEENQNAYVTPKGRP